MKQIEFIPPRGVVPEDAGANEDFDLVCSFRVKANGNVCLVKMGDAELPGYRDDSKHKPDYGEYAGQMMKPGESEGT